MIIQDRVEIAVSSRNKKHYIDCGYIIPEEPDSRGRIRTPRGSTISVLIDDLLKSCNIKVLCRCEDCMSERHVTYASLLARENSSFNSSGETLCVSCAGKRSSGVHNPNYIHGCSKYSEYKYGAKKRGYAFSLSADEFKDIISKKCHYCEGYSTDYNKRSRGNGIDRIDSAIGYILSNCVPCCSRCNFLKNTTSYSDFIKYIKKVYEVVKNYEV